MANAKNGTFNLIIERHGGVGDCLMASPIVRHFRHYPPLQAEGRKLRIIFSTQKRNHFLFEHTPWGPDGTRCVDEKVELFPIQWRLHHRDVEDQGFIEQCRANLSKIPYKPDAVISFFEAIERNPASDRKNAYDYHFEWIGLDPAEIPGDWKRPLYTPRPRELGAAQKLLAPCPGSKHKRIAVQMHASSLPRTWDKMDRLIRALCRRYPDAAVYSLGDPHAAILEPAPWERERNYMPLCGKTFGDGRLWGAIIASMDLLVGVDSGALHLAGALGVPLVGIFSTVPAWTRIKYYRDAVGIDSRHACAPCFRIGMTCGMSTPTPGQDFIPSMDLRGKNHAYPCLASIGVDEVMESVGKIH